MTIEEYLGKVNKFLDGLTKLSQEIGIGIAFGREGAASELFIIGNRPGRGSETVNISGRHVYHSGRFAVNRHVRWAIGAAA